MSLPASTTSCPTSLALITGRTRRQQRPTHSVRLHVKTTKDFDKRCSNTAVFVCNNPVSLAGLAAAHCCGFGSEGRARARCWEDGGNMSVSSAAIRGRNVLGLLRRLTQEEASQQKNVKSWTKTLPPPPPPQASLPACLSPPSAQRCWHAIK